MAKFIGITDMQGVGQLINVDHIVHISEYQDHCNINLTAGIIISVKERANILNRMIND